MLLPSSSARQWLNPLDSRMRGIKALALPNALMHAALSRAPALSRSACQRARLGLLASPRLSLLPSSIRMSTLPLPQISGSAITSVCLSFSLLPSYFLLLRQRSHLLPKLPLLSCVISSLSTEATLNYLTLSMLLRNRPFRCSYSYSFSFSL